MFMVRNSQNSETGSGVMQLLVALGIGAIVLTAALSHFFDSSHRSNDHQIMTDAQDIARTTLDLLTFELRMMGTGVPLSQDNFAIGGAGLGTAPLPVLTTATSSGVTFRFNETGKYSVLTADYTPAAASLTFSVADATPFVAGDYVYISNMPSMGEEGMRAKVSGVAGNNVSVTAAYVASAGAVFPEGSTVERVTEVVYNSPADWSGITRNDGLGAVVLAPNATFELVYLDDAGNDLGVPLTTNDIANSLAAIQVTVWVRGRNDLKSGESFTAEAQQVVALRNLNITR